MTVQVPEQRLIDIILLGDGFTRASDFYCALIDWLADFYTIKVYDVFSGCFRVRALYTPSDEPASAKRGSYYRCPLDANGGKIVAGDWWKRNDLNGTVFRERFWESVDTFADVNARRYPQEIDVGSANQAITNGRLRDLYRNLVVCLLIRSAATAHPSGFASDVYRPVPDQSRHVRVGFGAHEIHEFSHAFGLLSDEYINGRGHQE